MRGHWISTTRKLNKHYQGGGGTPPTPPPIDDLTLTWQRFVTTDAFCPVGFYHEDDPTKIPAHAPNNFYNMFVLRGRYDNRVIYDSILNTNLNFDLSKSNKLIGPYNRHSRYYIPSPNYGTLPNNYGDSNWLIHQGDEANLHNVSTFDPDYDSVTYHGSTYSDFGVRYTKFLVPKYLGSPYYNTYINGNSSIGGKVSFPTECKIDLSAIASKAFAEQYSGIYQTVTIKTGPSSSDVSTIRLGTNGTMCPYDLEQNGQSYIEFNMALDGGSLRVKIRIYNFYYDGCFYVDQKPHVFNRDTGEEIETDRVSIRRLAYPYPLLGFCGMNPFYQPSGLYYPSYPSYGSVPLPSPSVTGILDVDGYYDQDGRARKYYTYYEKDWDNGTQSQYSIKNYPLFLELVQEEVPESTFWATERAWHAIHGGTPYLTPSV